MNVVGFVLNEGAIAQPTSVCPMPVICPLMLHMSLPLKDEGSGN